MIQGVSVSESDLPQLFVAADRASTKGQTAFLRGTRARLLLVVGAAACGVGQWRVGAGHDDLLGLLGVVLFVMAALVEGYLWKLRPERDWYDGRALAESVKTLAWKYAVGGDPFPASMNEREAGNTFTRLLQDLRRPYARMSLEAVPGEAVTSWMSTLRRAGSDVRRATYIEDRVVDQQRWYAKKSRENRKRATQWRFVLIASEIVGVVMGLVESLTSLDLRFTPALAASVGATVAWLETKQHEQIARAYSTTVSDLSDVLSKLRAVPDEEDWAREMNDAEDAISREHTLWLASRSQV